MEALPSPLDDLIEHLEREERALLELEQVLEREASALRALDYDTLSEMAKAKERLGEAHSILTADRGPRLRAVAPDIDSETLSAVRAKLLPAQAMRLAEVHARLAETTHRVVDLHRKNTVFAESGKQSVDGLLRVVHRMRAGGTTTYGPGGQIGVAGRAIPVAGTVVERKG